MHLKITGDLVKVPILFQDVWGARESAFLIHSQLMLPLLPIRGPHTEEPVTRALSCAGSSQMPLPPPKRKDPHLVAQSQCSFSNIEWMIYTYMNYNAVYGDVGDR